MSTIRDISLAPLGRKRIEWVKDFMPVLSELRERFIVEQPFKGMRISVCVHLEAKTAYLATCLAAGLEGIRQKMTPPVCMDKMTEIEMDECEKLPRTLHEAVKQFKQDAFLKDVLGEHISGHLVYTKDEEWNEYCQQVTTWEMERYLGTI